MANRGQIYGNLKAIVGLFVGNFREYGPICRSRSRFIPKSDRLLGKLTVYPLAYFLSLLIPSPLIAESIVEYNHNKSPGDNCDKSEEHHQPAVTQVGKRLSFRMPGGCEM